MKGNYWLGEPIWDHCTLAYNGRDITVHMRVHQSSLFNLSKVERPVLDVRQDRH
jgi:hypothetical protein